MILNSEILAYHCSGTEDEIKSWFKTINIVGIPLNNQELRNAVYSGPFVTAAKEYFSNSHNSNIQAWNHYLRGNIKRQEILEEALKWISDGHIDAYMSKHRNKDDITEVKSHFDSVISWVSTTFLKVRPQMKGIDWNTLYKKYHLSPYSPEQVEKRAG
jgi:hypothetical protein